MFQSILKPVPESAVGLLYSFFGSKAKAPALSPEDAEIIKNFETQLSILKVMDIKIVLAMASVLMTYYLDYNKFLAISSSFLTIAISRRIDFYPNYSEILEKLIGIYQKSNAAYQQVLLEKLRPYLAAGNQTDTWFFSLYGQNFQANPLLAVLPEPLRQGINVASIIATADRIFSPQP